MMGFSIKLVLLVVLLASAEMASAQWYQVEIIVFEQVNPVLGDEDWYKDPGLVPLIGTVKPVYPLTTLPVSETEILPGQQSVVKPRVAYAILPEDKYKLQTVYQTLRQSRDYRSLYHVAWQQPGYDGNRARALHLQEYDSGSLFELTMPATLVTDSLPAEFYEPVKLLLDGTVRIRSSSFLHVDLDMVLFRPVFNTVTSLNLPISTDLQGTLVEKPPQYVRLTESRRIRLNDLQYFDHPRFGVIMQVSRYVGDSAESGD
jgi:hypothetical protein